MKKITLCLGLLLSLGLSAQALDPEKSFVEKTHKITSIPQLLELVRETGEKKQFNRQEVVLTQLLKLRPYSPDFKFALIKAYAAQDKKSEAYNALIELQKAGLSYPIGDREGFDKIKGTKVFDFIEDGMKNNAMPFGEGSKVFEVSDSYSGLLFENIAYDTKANRFLLGSIRSGEIYQYNESTGFSKFANPANPGTGPWGVVDIAIDVEADVLWTASATMPHYNGTTQANFGQSMITKLKLSTGEVIKSFAMAESAQPMLFSNLHVTKGQNLYFTNVFGNDVFKIASGSEQVEPQFSLNGLNAIKSLTSNADETIIYVSDFELGIFVINLETKQTVPLVRDQAGFFAGINDLFYDGGDLVAIQSGVKPARLMRYVLQQDLFLQNMFPIEASNPNFNEVGNGTLVGDQIYYVANTQWVKLDGLGRLLPDQSWDPLVIMKSPTKYLMEEHMEQQRQMEEIKRKRGLK